MSRLIVLVTVVLLMTAMLMVSRSQIGKFVARTHTSSDT